MFFVLKFFAALLAVGMNIHAAWISTIFFTVCVSYNVPLAPGHKTVKMSKIKFVVSEQTKYCSYRTI